MESLSLTPEPKVNVKSDIRLKESSGIKSDLKPRKADYRPIGSIQILSSMIMINNKEFSSGLCHAYIRTVLPTELKIGCMLRFEGLKRTDGTHTFRDYASSRHPKYNLRFKFRGKAIGPNTNIYVSCAGSQPRHTLSLVYQLRGTKRNHFKRDLLHVLQSVVHAHQVNDLDKDLATKEGNF